MQGERQLVLENVQTKLIILSEKKVSTQKLQENLYTEWQ